jgi:hypothetical protein
MKLTKEQKAAKALAQNQKMEAIRSEQAKRDSFLAITKNGIKFHMEQLKDENSRLDFLTDIFTLTEDLRHEISWQKENLEFSFDGNIPEGDSTSGQVPSDEIEILPNSNITGPNSGSDRKEECVTSAGGDKSGNKKITVEDLNSYTKIAIRKSDKRKFLYKYLLTKSLIKVLDTETGETEQYSQGSFLRNFRPDKKTNKKNHKRNFMNFGRKRVA